MTNYDALNQMTTYTYDAYTRLLTTTQPNGLVTTNSYGGDGYLAQTVDVGFRTNSFTYSNALVYSHTDERGLSVTNTSCDVPSSA